MASPIICNKNKKCERCETYRRRPPRAGDLWYWRSLVSSDNHDPTVCLVFKVNADLVVTSGFIVNKRESLYTSSAMLSSHWWHRLDLDSFTED